MCALFAATYPERTSALVMSGCYPKWIRDADYPWAPTREDHEAAFLAYERNWGRQLVSRSSPRALQTTSSPGIGGRATSAWAQALPPGLRSIA